MNLEPKKIVTLVVATLVVASLIIGAVVVSWAFGNGNSGTPAAVKIEIKNFAFNPQNITITPGTTVSWTNDDAVAHEIATQSGAPASFDSGPLEPGNSFSFSFSIPGVYPFYCKIHTYMTGEVIVSSGGNSVSIYLSAHNIAFNKTAITVPAGANVSIHFDNLDSGTPHNFAVYVNSSASTALFQGAIITGVSSTIYVFKAPTTPGAYFFRCDVHPAQMTGTFIVQ